MVSYEAIVLSPLREDPSVDEASRCGIFYFVLISKIPEVPVVMFSLSPHNCQFLNISGTFRNTKNYTVVFKLNRVTEGFPRIAVFTLLALGLCSGKESDTVIVYSIHSLLCS